MKACWQGSEQPATCSCILATPSELRSAACAPPTLPPLQNTLLSPHLPAWVLSLPIQKLWVASNQLSQLLPTKAGRVGARQSGMGLPRRLRPPLPHLTSCAWCAQVRACKLPATTQPHLPGATPHAPSSIKSTRYPLPAMSPCPPPTPPTPNPTPRGAPGRPCHVRGPQGGLAVAPHPRVPLLQRLPRGARPAAGARRRPAGAGPVVQPHTAGVCVCVSWWWWGGWGWGWGRGARQPAWDPSSGGSARDARGAPERRESREGAQLCAPVFNALADAQLAC